MLEHETPVHALLVLMSRDFSPLIRIGEGSPEGGPCDVRHEDELAESQDERADGLEPVQGPHGWRVVVHPSRHALEAEEVHREEDEVHADQSESEMPTGEALGVRAPRHRREPEVDAREDVEDLAA